MMKICICRFFVNKRNGKTKVFYLHPPDSFHKYPVHMENEVPVRKEPGKPKGFKNRIPKEKVEMEIKEKKKPGRPPGAKNKKTLEKEEKNEQVIKRGPGRPKKSDI